MLSVSSVFAQIGPSPAATNTPNLGIYGSAPPPPQNGFPCGPPRYANLELYPDPTQGEGLTSWNQILPLNGLKNFNFYYTADGAGFLSGGGYRVTYLNVNYENCYGLLGDIVTYSPNRLHTNGVQVRPFNLGAYTTPRGIHGVILARVPGGGGNTVPLADALASVGNGIYKAKTNGIGYFSIYYANSGTGNGFLPYASQYSDAKVTGFIGNCYYEWNDDVARVWVVNTLDNNPGYYVEGAEADIGTKIVSSLTPGCAP